MRTEAYRYDMYPAPYPPSNQHHPTTTLLALFCLFHYLNTWEPKSVDLLTCFRPSNQHAPSHKPISYFFISLSLPEDMIVVSDRHYLYPASHLSPQITPSPTIFFYPCHELKNDMYPPNPIGSFFLSLTLPEQTRTEAYRYDKYPASYLHP